MKRFLKATVPRPIFSAYYFLWGFLGALRYGFPSRRLLVIGITGTKGKTSTANFIWSAAMACGVKTGVITTANVRIGNEEFLNEYHMTMPGRFAIQKLLARMVKAGCEACVVETTSEGLVQSRHSGIDYDVAIFTNLTPEHLPSHGGSFEKYKQAKGILFTALMRSIRKNFRGRSFPKTIIANADSEHGGYFLNFPADRKISFGIGPKAQVVAKNIRHDGSSVAFHVESSLSGLNSGKLFKLAFPGVFNVYNALPAVALLRSCGFSDDPLAQGLQSLSLIPGRMEWIKEGQDFGLIVDYAHEKESMTALLDTAREICPVGKVIVLLGAEGGGRDKRKRPLMGEVAAKKADFVITSNVDPYEDDPLPILEDIARAAEDHGKVRGKDLFVIEDRRSGIRKALSLARSGDLVLITGKGAEQSMILPSGSIPWDDRVVVREVLKESQV